MHKVKIAIVFQLSCYFIVTLFCAPSWSAEQVIIGAPTNQSVKQQDKSGYVAKGESIQLLFNALSSEIKKPLVLSKLAQKKTITGDFDITRPLPFLDKISTQIGLAWYDDGQTIYVYDNSELKNAVIVLRNASLATLNDFLQRTGLYSKRYTIRGESKTSAFYVAGPPIYVELVVNAAAYLDDLYKNVDLNKQKISVIKLQHTFVSDRSYRVRDQEVRIAGIGNVIESILSGQRNESISIHKEKNDPTPDRKELLNGLWNDAVNKQPTAAAATTRSALASSTDNQIKVIPYPETNSLLVKGTIEQIDLIQDLIAQLDVPKRHVELSLWVIDITKNALDKLGVDWQGAIDVGSRVGISLNTMNGNITTSGNTTPSDIAGSISTLDGPRFMAQINALNQQGIAQVVSRPIILTQDNVPSNFDHNSTFYTKLQADRFASLESVTYGTLINVLPRFSSAGDEVEMILDIEDGQQAESGGLVDGLPIITRTKISTVARVPKDKSLLIGGYTLDRFSNVENKIPLLGDIPFIGGAFRSTSEINTKMIRIFLIQPKLLDVASSWNGQQFSSPPLLAPELPLSETLRTLKAYAGENHVTN